MESNDLLNENQDIELQFNQDFDSEAKIAATVDIELEDSLSIADQVYDLLPEQTKQEEDNAPTSSNRESEFETNPVVLRERHSFVPSDMFQRDHDRSQVASRPFSQEPPQQENSPTVNYQSPIVTSLLIPESFASLQNLIEAQQSFSLPSTSIQIFQFGGKSVSTEYKLVNIDLFQVGQMFGANAVLNDHARITVDNLANGPDLGSILDTNDSKNGYSKLQAPWASGNIKDDPSGYVFIIARDANDVDQDLILDRPRPELGDPSGIIQITFDSPIYEFGWDIFNLDNKSELQRSSITFYDAKGNSVVVPFKAFTDANSVFYDSTLAFAVDSANRIQPITIVDLKLTEISSLEFNITGEVGLANFNWQAENITLDSNVFQGNLFANNSFDPQEMEIKEISFTFGSSQEALDYEQANPHLNVTVDDNIVKLLHFNQPMNTPLNGTITIQANGEFNYTPALGLSAPAIEDVSLAVINLNNAIETTTTTQLNIVANIPLANANDNYTNAGFGQHNYNLVFVVDVSKSISGKIYNFTRLELVQMGLVDLIEQYEQFADNLNITIIPFSQGSNLTGAFSYHATDAADAKEFISKEGAHVQDGLAKQMINPDTGIQLGKNAEYNDALYHARVSLEQDLMDINLNDYQHMVYFIADGKPPKNHSATDTSNWPIQWGSWQDFIQNPASQLPGANADFIDVFAFDIDPKISLEQYFEPIASSNKNIFELEQIYFELKPVLLDTLPNHVSGNVLNNDLYHNGSYVASVQLENAQLLNVPLDGSNLSVITPLGGKLLINNQGNYFYIPPKVSSEAQESFTYSLLDMNTQQSSQAKLTLHIYPDTNPVEHLQATSGNDTLSSENKSGILYLTGGQGDDHFMIDFANEDVSVLYINDLKIGQNKLSFMNVPDLNQDNKIDMADVFKDFSQAQPNANIVIELNNANSLTQFAGTQLILENMGTVLGTNLSDLISHLDQTVMLEVL